MLTPDQVQLLEEAYQADASDEQAASFAHITLLELYDHLAINTDTGWIDKIRLSRHRPIVQGKVNLTNSVLQGNLDDSKYLLERRLPQEFSPKAQLNITNDTPMVLLPERPSLASPTDTIIHEDENIIDVIATSI